MIGNTSRSDFSGLQIFSPVRGCFFMIAHSNRSEVRSFFQNFIGHCNLAEVMKISAAAQRDERFAVQAEMLAKISGFASEPFAVSLGVRVARFDAEARACKGRIRRSPVRP